MWTGIPSFESIIYHACLYLSYAIIIIQQQFSLQAGRRISTKTRGLDDVFPPYDFGSVLYINVLSYTRHVLYQH